MYQRNVHSNRRAMVDYTNPVETTFEMQRRSIKQGQQAMEQTLLLPARVGEATVEGLDGQESLQRRFVEFQQESLHSVLDAIDEAVPGAAASTDEVRAAVDDQYEMLLDNHAEFFENLERSVEEGFDAYDELSEESIEALSELIESMVEAHEELEAQSVEATEQVTEQVDEIQEQVEEVQAQIQRLSEEAAEAVEA